LQGNGTPGVLNERTLQILRNAGFISERDALSYDSCLYDSIRYTPNSYSEGKKYDDSWVKTNTGLRGSIEEIVQLNCQGKSTIVFLLKEVKVSDEPILINPLVTITHI